MVQLPVSNIHQPVQMARQPVRKIYQPVRMAGQPVRKIHQPIRTAGQPGGSFKPVRKSFISPVLQKVVKVCFPVHGHILPIVCSRGGGGGGHGMLGYVPVKISLLSNSRAWNVCMCPALNKCRCPISPHPPPPNPS